ncbi:PRC-barrel domain-containing protein [Methylobacterium sp. BTF04]|uniref:PRC-barrel domain-containing protein n=1 Tax=Methylobacterium sp. BTF04 TaxID=2708300 RepID=UPI0019547CAE|nr:PRC-barrel domain-containing protein [Methylobacterium sp. BTF04]
MLRHASVIEGYGINATDGPIGTIVDFLFDDITWLVRWLVVDTGAFLPGRKVLLPPSALSHVNHMGGELAVSITKQTVKDSPDIRTDQPVSRVMETNLYDFYGWSPYWSTGFYMGGYGYPLGTGFLGAGLGFHAGNVNDRKISGEGVVQGDRHLRSITEVTGYHIHARDGEIGHVADFLMEDGDWSVHYLVVDTKNWWPAKKVLISPRSIKRTDWSSRMVYLDVLRQQVKDSPAYDGTVAVDRAYEYAFHGYYDRLPVAEPA